MKNLKAFVNRNLLHHSAFFVSYSLFFEFPQVSWDGDITTSDLQYVPATRAI